MQTAQWKTSVDASVQEALDALAPAPGQVVALDPASAITAANFEYADLLKGGALGRCVRAVIEKDGSPLVYVAAFSKSDSFRGEELARLLGNRGETALLLEVHQDAPNGQIAARAWPCSLDARAFTPVDLASSTKAASVLGDLQDGLWAKGEAYQEQRLRDLLVRSVSKVRAEFLKATAGAGERSDEVLALVGRALFVRFLLDRGILSAKTAPELSDYLADDGIGIFGSHRSAAAVSAWLDRTFNGEFLPLPASSGYQSYFKRLSQDSPGALAPLGWIVGKTDAEGQLPMWDLLDFSYIPVGTLSEVYEEYVHERSPDEAKAKSVHFTPRHIARMMVRQALAGLPVDKAADASVLDPSVGAAVYLSLAYRELARLRHMRDGKWPETAALRDILYDQLCGMDLNAFALNLAALTLYLTAIELDENPVPPAKLKFKHRLIGTVLLDVGRPDPKELHAEVLGSLRRSGGATRKYDVVVGNPPWTSLKLEARTEERHQASDSQASDAFNIEAEAIARRCISDRLAAVQQAPYDHPDKVPDLAFVWKATEWAVEGGIICLVVHQRLLTKRSDTWAKARRALFSCVQITGILDASEFANHDKLLWPTIETPYCVLFARNSAPPQGHKSMLMTLAVEPVLTKRRQVRLDPSAVVPLSVEDFDRMPGGLVTRLKGCELDAALLERWHGRIASSPACATTAGRSARDLPLTTVAGAIASFCKGEPRRGYKKGNRGATLRDWVQQLPTSTKLFAAAKDRLGGEIFASDIHEEFVPMALKSTPAKEYYQPPMLLLHQGAGNVEDLKRASLIMPGESRELVLYPFAFLGVPFEQTSDNVLYAKYVSLWINSSILSYFATLTSTQFGFGIKALLNEDLLDAPIMDMRLAIDRQLTSKQEIDRLFGRLGPPSGILASDIDDWAMRIIGADADERQLIFDTLSVSYPIGPSRQSGRSWVSRTQVSEFVKQLRLELAELDDVVDIDSVKTLATGDELSGWRFVTWSCPHARCLANLDGLDSANLLRLVRDAYPQGQVWGIAPGGQFVFGQLALRRLWLSSRACLAAQVLGAWIDQSVA